MGGFRGETMILFWDKKVEGTKVGRRVDADPGLPFRSRTNLLLAGEVTNDKTTGHSDM